MDEFIPLSYQENPDDEFQLWALVPRNKTEEWAGDLLESLWDQYKSPRVFIDGVRFRRNKPKGWKAPEDDQESETSIRSNGIPSGALILKARKIQGLLRHGDDPNSGRWAIWHVPTRMIIAHPTSKWDAMFLAREFARYARKGFSSADLNEVRRSLPKSFAAYLSQRGFKVSFENWKASESHIL